MTTVAEITARDWSPKLGSFGAVVTSVADIAQCLRIIFTTPIGSVPLRRNFGSRIHRSIDKPFPVAQANIPLDVSEAAQWEPRAIIRSVQVRHAEVMYGLAVGIEWAEQESGAIQTLTLTAQDFSAPTISATSDLNAIAAKVAGMIGSDTNDFMRKSEYASTKFGTVRAAEKLRNNSPNGTEYETEFENGGRLTTNP